MDPIQAKIALAEEQIRVLTQQRDHERNPEQKVACTNEIAGIHNHIADMRNERTALITQQGKFSPHVSVVFSHSSCFHQLTSIL